MNHLLSSINKYKTSFNNKKIINNILHSYQSNDFYKYVDLQENIYTRKLLLKNDLLEVYLLSWYPNSESHIHDHACNGCYMKVLDGKLMEYKYDSNTLKLKEKIKYKKNDVSFIDNSLFYHKIINNNNNPSFSLHIYSPPKHKTTFYTGSS